MRLRTRYAGRAMPFERQRRLVLRRLPAGAVITRAALTLTPYSVDPERRFLETIRFPGAVGDWGANKVRPAGAVEVDLHGRRKLASLTGVGLAGGTLLVDLGAGYHGVTATGGLGDGPELPLADAMDLPGLTVTGFRVARPAADISAVGIVSPPTNLTVAIEGGPVFYTRTGDLVEAVTTPDFSMLLQGMLGDLPLENGCSVVPFVVGSDSISRLDLDLDLEFTIAVSGTPEGLATVRTDYRYDGSPTTPQGLLGIAVPPGMVAVPGGTAGRAQGGFEASKVVFGALTPTVTEHVAISPRGPLAQPFTLPAAAVAGSVDLLLGAVTAEATLTVDVMTDLDGKPGRTSRLARTAELTLSRDTAGSPTWLNVPLPAELELPAGVRHWLLVQVREGAATWAAGAAPEPLQRTADGGLSWRAVAGLGARLRLRHVTSAFEVPLELRVAAGAAEVTVPLQRFAAQGSIDLDLAVPEVAAAVNTAVAAARPADVSAEHVANGDFSAWYRVGTAVSGPWPLGVDGGESLGPAVTFAADGGTIFVGGQADGEARLISYDTFTRERGFDEVIGTGSPRAMAVDPTGEHLVVALLESTADGPASAMQLASTTGGGPVGAAIAVPEEVRDVVRVADGSGVLLLGREQSEAGIAVVRFVSWSELRTGAPDWSRLPSVRVDGMPRALAAGPDGAIYLLVDGDGTSRLLRYPDKFGLTAGNSSSVALSPGARDVAVVASRHQVLVLGPVERAPGQPRVPAVHFLRASELTPVGTVDLPANASVQCLAVDPADEVAVVVQDGEVLTVDVRRRVLLPRSAAAITGTSDGAEIAISPAGIHAVVTAGGEARLLTLGAAQPTDWELTAGEVRPFAFPATGEVLALLGTENAGGGRDRSSRPAPRPAALSQSFGVLPATRYRFAFDGISEDEEAVGQLIWRGAGCARGRTDRVAVTSFDPYQRTALEHVPRHELVVTSPAGATQVEIRFFTPGGGTAVDHVSLAGAGGEVSTVATDWQPSAATVLVAPAAAGVALTNGGSAAAVVSRLLPVGGPAADRFELRLTARVSGAPATLELVFGDETEVSLGPPARLPLDPLDFDDRAMAGPVPTGTAVAELRFVVPPGGSVEVAAVSLVCAAAQEVGLQFVSQAPGALAVTGLVVQLDEGQPAVAPLPRDGLCPSTPAGDGPDGEACFCGACGENRPVRRQAAAVTPAGRPAAIAVCPVCRTPRIRLGGRPAGHAEEVPLPRFRVVDRPAGAPGPAIVARLRADVPLTAVPGIAASRAADLARAGIPDGVALASADVRVVASVRGVSDRMARRFVARAAELARAQGQWVIFPA